MSSLKIKHTEVHTHFPGTAAKIHKALTRKIRKEHHRSFEVSIHSLQWFYTLLPRKSRDNRGPGDVRFGISATYGHWKHKVDDWEKHDPQSAGFIPPALQYVATLQKEGVTPRNTPHDAVISWHHPSGGEMTDYLVSAGVEMADGRTRIAIVWIGAPIIPLGLKAVKRPYVWVCPTENGIELPNDVPSRLSDLVFATEPGEGLFWSGEKMRRLSTEEIKRFDGLAYEGRQRIKEVASV